MWGREVPAALHKNSVHLNHSHSPKAAWIQKAWSFPKDSHRWSFQKGSHLESSWRAASPSSLLPTPQAPDKCHVFPESPLLTTPLTPPNTPPPHIVPRQSSSSQTVCSHVGFLMNFKLWFGVPFIGSDPQDCENIRIINQHTLSVSSIFETSVPHSLWIFT